MDDALMPHVVQVVPKTSLAVRYAGGYWAREVLTSRALRDSKVDNMLVRRLVVTSVLERMF